MKVVKERKPYSPRIKYNIGMRFHNFIIDKRVKSILSRTGRSYTAWKCRCDCGNEFIGTTKEIQKGKKSCGCLSKSNRFKKIPHEIVMTNIRFGHYKNGAKRRNLEWGLTIKQFTNLIKNNCHYCGVKPSLKLKRRKNVLLINGVDRVNSKIGYITTNVVSCCSTCNFAKGSLTELEFKEWIKRVYLKTIVNENI